MIESFFYIGIILLIRYLPRLSGIDARAAESGGQSVADGVLRCAERRKVIPSAAQT